MEPIHITQQTEQQLQKPEAPISQNISADSLTRESGYQSQELRNELEQQKEQSIVEQFAKRVPLHSLELKKRLQAGPPPEFGKFQKIQWTSDLNQQIQKQEQKESELLKKQALFFAPSEQLLNDMVRQKGTLPENASAEQTASLLTDAMTNAAAVDTQKLIPDPSALSPDAASLKELFTELSALTAQTFTEKQAKDCTARYHALGMEASASAGRYLDEAGTMDPASCYVILFHCVTLMLQYHLNTLGTDKVDPTEFSKLYALASATGFAANAMILNQDYQSRRQSHLNQLAAKAEAERIAKEEAAKAQAAQIAKEAAVKANERSAKIEAQKRREMFRAARKQYLYTGTSADGKEKEWPLAPYAHMAETILGEALYTLSDKELGLAVWRMEENLKVNTAAIRLLYHNRMKENPAMAELENAAMSEIPLHIKESLLKERLEVSSAVILDALTHFTKDHTEELSLYENRLNQLKSMLPLELLSVNLSSAPIRNLIYTKKTKEEFDTAAALLQKQAQKNIDLAKELIAEKITYKNRSSAMQFLVDRIGHILLFGAPSVVFMESEYLLDYLYQFAPQIAYAEDSLRRQIQNAGIDSCWIPAVSKYLADTNTPAEKEAQELQKLKKSIDVNQQSFDAAIKDLKKSSAQWQELFQWQAENITLSANDFTRSLNTLLQEAIPADGGLTIKSYQKGPTAKRPAALKPVSNVQLLRGSDLCKWNGFDGFLTGQEDAVIDALAEALSEKQFPLPCLKNILTLNDLDTLPLQEFTEFLTLLRSNIGKALTEWKNIKSAYPKEIQRRLLKELICGNLTSENILMRAAQEESQLEKRSKAEKLRFLSFMGGTAPSLGEVRYLYLKDTKTSAVTREPSRAVRRKQRFQNAENLWKQIQASHFENLLHDLWISASEQGNNAPFAFIRTKLAEYINQLETSVNPPYAEISELKNLLVKFPEYTPHLTANNDKFEREFMLKGMEDELLSYQDAFTVQDIELYNQTLLNLEKIVISRYKQLDSLLKTVFPTDLAQVRNYHAKAKKMLTGLEPLDGSKPTETQQESNRARFGVSSWEDALEKIKEFITPANSPLQEQTKEAAALLKKREGQLIGYKDGVLKPFCSLILQHQETFQVLMTAEEDGIPQYLSVLEQWFRNPYEALKRYNPEAIFAQEFIIEKKDLFWEQKNSDLNYWKTETENYYKAYCSYEIKKGISIDSRYQELSKSLPTLAPYLMQIIFTDADGISMLRNSTPKSLNKKLRNFKTQIEQNTICLNSFFENMGGISKPELLAGFKLYLQPKIPFTKPEDFRANLPKWWEAFHALDAVTKKEAQMSAQVLSKRAQTLLHIESKRQSGIEADRADQALIENIQNQAKFAASPVLLALGQQNSSSAKAYSANKKKISEKYADQPDIIQDILLESSLLDTKKAQLDAEAKWLSAAYKTIVSVPFSAGESSIHLDGDAAKELLMVMFAKWKATGKDSTPDMLQDTFRALTDCHRLLQELTDLPIQDTGLLMERDHLAETLAAGMYCMEKEEFEAFITRRISYLKASSEAISVFLDETKAFGKEQAALCSGLREYFHEDLIKGEKALDPDVLRKQTKKLLTDKHIRQFLKNSSSLMEQISSTDEIKLTSAHHTLAQRSDLESYLSSLPDNAAFRSYKKLDLAQRQIFAMALSAPGQEELRLPNARFLKDEKLTYAFRIQMQEQLHYYISHDTFTPIVDYTSALTHLKNPDGTLNKEAFRHAMAFTNAVIFQHLQNIPVDWDRLSDSASSYITANQLKGTSYDPNLLTVTSTEEFLQRIQDADHDSSDVSTLKKELSSLTQHQLQLLIHALTDRTILDRSTKITAKDRAKNVLHAYANAEKRADLMDLLIHDPSAASQSAQSSQTLSAAMASLMSYQIRDDIVLTGRSLHTNDFAPKALERKTALDWNLLSEALSFVHEIEQETLRLNAIKQAGALILESKNKAAVKEYQIQQNERLSSQEDFENYLQMQAKKDGMAALYAGYKQLDAQERALFIKALTKRHLLDISKKNINLNRLGLAERQYADEQGRNELLDEYMAASLTKDGTVELDENAYRQAVYMTLSTQISDDADFTKKKEQSLFSSQKSTRSTAVDWKLVQRALQFVHRADNERDIFRQDQELYAAQGNLLKTGHFSFDSAHLRKNIHSSGSRFGRYLRRRVQDNLLDQIPAYLKPILKQAVTTGREQLSAAQADRINKLGIFDDSEEKKETLLKKASTLTEWEDGFYKDFWKSSAIARLGEKKEENFRGIMENASDSLTYLNAARTAGTVVHNFYQLNRAQKNSENALRQDQRQTEEAALHQTAEQKELSEKAIKRNLSLQKQGRTKAYERQVDAVIDTAAEVIGTAAVDKELLETAVTEAGKLINFIRNYVNDKSSVVKFFQANGELEKLKTAYDTMEWEGKKEALSDIDLIRKMKGYENYTELANFVGLNITRSLLFCAGKYNPQEHLRYLAVATLAAIDMTEAIGQQDAKTAESVFQALMGSEYR